ncbi:MAG TPA: flagellar hook-associated protein 3 [Phycisphaerales bacterium]|nr:MAG: flagellar hook-associated protein 3 [Planctomycetes bacterium GWC2_45_44]HBG78603.1 flagellar hook-associated protein 3 [Phycisphaerales bacterium]HBR20699.1 flagellar hook-associated protein 3 [Phycisphaerales bacterium]
MGGSLTSIYNNVSFALNMHTAAMTKLQEQTATGSRINRISDDPSSAYQVLGLNSQTRYLQNYLDNIAQTSDTLGVVSNVLGNMTSSITKVQTDLTQISSGTYSQDSRERLAEGINDVLEQMVSLANTRSMNQYVFSGGKTTEPYAVTRSNDEITSVSYQGASQSQNIEVSQSVQATLLYAGEDLFSSSSRSAPVFYGDTGAANGSGTSNVKGDVWLTVTGSPGSYKLSIDGGATEWDVTGDISNVAVSNADGEVLYVDATNITSTGTNLVRVPGTYDIFSSLISIRDILKNTQNLSDEQLKEFRGVITQSLDEINSQLTNKQTLVGSKIGFLEDLKESLENVKLNTEDQATAIEQADVAQIAIELSMREILYQMSLSVTGKLMSVSLLDFIE